MKTAVQRPHTHMGLPSLAERTEKYDQETLTGLLSLG